MKYHYWAENANFLFRINKNSMYTDAVNTLSTNTEHWNIVRQTNKYIKSNNGIKLLPGWRSILQRRRRYMDWTVAEFSRPLHHTFTVEKGMSSQINLIASELYRNKNELPFTKCRKRTFTDTMIQNDSAMFPNMYCQTTHIPKLCKVYSATNYQHNTA